MSALGKLRVYGAGDPDTVSLLSELRALGVDAVFMDIRKRDASNEFANLVFIARQNLTSVPQVFQEDDIYLGNYEAAMVYIRRYAPKIEASAPAPRYA